MRGTLGMARAKTPTAPTASSSSASSRRDFLDGKYTVFGQVTAGMEAVDAIKKGDPNDNGSVTNPDKIVKMQVAADAKGK